MLGCPCHLIHLAAEKAAAQLPVSESKSGHSSKNKSTQSSSKDKATHSSSKDMSTHSKEKSTHSGSKDASTHSSSSKDNSGFDLAGYLSRQQTLAKSSQAKKKTSSCNHTAQDCNCKALQPLSPWAQKRVKRACQHLKDPTFKLYCYFLSAVLSVFDEANTLLQLDKPCIHVLHRTLTTQLKDLLNRFVMPEDQCSC